VQWPDYITLMMNFFHQLESISFIFIFIFYFGYFSILVNNSYERLGLRYSNFYFIINWDLSFILITLQIARAFFWNHEPEKVIFFYSKIIKANLNQKAFQWLFQLIVSSSKLKQYPTVSPFIFCILKNYQFPSILYQN